MWMAALSFQTILSGAIQNKWAQSQGIGLLFSGKSQLIVLLLRLQIETLSNVR
jgi:hypothetical protein